MPHNLAWCHEQLLLMHRRANVGHVGSTLSCLEGIYTTFQHLQPADRFVLSKGHAAGALYTVLAANDIIPSEWLNTFHQDGTSLPGHPPANKLPAIPFATGSLGHGLSLAAGFALSQKLRQTGNQTYCLTSDGEWQEGSTWEALIFLSHHQLTNLTILIDHNGWQGFGRTRDVASMYPLYDKLAPFAVDLRIVDGHDVSQISHALTQPTQHPKVIVLQTTKGHGLPDLADTLQSHYLPISPDQLDGALDYFHGRSL